MESTKFYGTDSQTLPFLTRILTIKIIIDNRYWMLYFYAIASSKLLTFNITEAIFNINQCFGENSSVPNIKQWETEFLILILLCF